MFLYYIYALIIGDFSSPSLELECLAPDGAYRSSRDSSTSACYLSESGSRFWCGLHMGEPIGGTTFRSVVSVFQAQPHQYQVQVYHMARKVRMDQLRWMSGCENEERTR